MPSLTKNDPRYKILLEKTGLSLHKNGDLNAQECIEKMRATNLSEIPEGFRKLADSLKKEAKELLEKSKEYARKSAIKNLRDLKIENIPESIADKPWEVFTAKEAHTYLPIVQDIKNKAQEEWVKKQLSDIEKSLIAKIEWLKRLGSAADALYKWNTAEKIIKSNQKAGLRELWEALDSEQEKKKSQIAQEVAIARAEWESHRDLLSEYGINSLEKAQEGLKKLREKWKSGQEKSEKEKILESLLQSYITSKVREAQIYAVASQEFGDSEAQNIFQETNRFVSSKPQEEYSFDTLKRTALITDSEIATGEKTLLSMESWKTVSMTSLFSREWESFVRENPEIESIMIMKDRDGGYSIPSLGIASQSYEQIMEYKNYMKLYAELWLSQLIPQISTIHTELRATGIDTEVDGSISITKQKEILKSLYERLFHEKIISSNLSEIKRAFWIALEEPSDMRIAMQGTLKKSRLISNQNEPAKPSSIQNWIRANPPWAKYELDQLNLT